MADLFRFFRKTEQKVPISQEKAPVQETAKENFLNGADWLRVLQTGSVGGIKSKFVSDIYKERILYPHEEMLLAKKGFRYNAYVNSAVTTRARFMTGGKIEVKSEDPGTQAWCNSILLATELGKKVSQFVSVDLITTGNGYLERIRDEKGQIIYYDYISTPERMYADLDQYGMIQQYLQELPEFVTGIRFDTIKYYGDRRKTIKGKLIPKEKIVHFKIGVAEIAAYGRGPVSACVNDIEILLEIERSLAVIARYKAIPKKLIMLNRGDDINGGKAAEVYANQISNLSDIENAVLPEQATVEDLSYSGKDVNFEPIVNYLKKKITVSLAPSFIMHGDETNYAVSRDQKEAFILTVQAERESVAEIVKRELKFIAKSQNVPIKDFEVKFGEFDLGQNDDKKNYAKDLYQANIITLNEAREIVGLPADSDSGDFYNAELGMQAALFGNGAQLPAEDTDNTDVKTKDAKEALK